MYEVGKQVTVVSEKGLGYSGYVLAQATSEDGTNAYKISVDGNGLEQMGQWYKACDVFVVGAEKADPMKMPESLEGIVHAGSEAPAADPK